jgi:hypothetical protein
MRRRVDAPMPLSRLRGIHSLRSSYIFLLWELATILAMVKTLTSFADFISYTAIREPPHLCARVF